MPGHLQNCFINPGGHLTGILGGGHTQGMLETSTTHVQQGDMHNKYPAYIRCIWCWLLRVPIPRGFPPFFPTEKSHPANLTTSLAGNPQRWNAVRTPSGSYTAKPGGKIRYLQTNVNYLVVSTHPKNISQNGNLPQIWVKMQNKWNHHHVNIHHIPFHIIWHHINHLCVYS